MKILAIDDNQDNLTTLQAIVQDVLPACTLLTVLNGPRGLELALAEDPDVILLDIIMPDMDGYEVCRRLKADERSRLIPVVFMTSLRADRESRIQALHSGAEGFLAKPMDELELVATVRAMAKIKEAALLHRDETTRLAGLVAERTQALQESKRSLLNTLEDMRAENEARRQAGEALRASQQLIEGILNAIPVRVFWKDKNLVYLGCNTIFAQDAGFFCPVEVIGKTDNEMIWHEQAEFYRNDDRAVIESGRPKLLYEEEQNTPEGKKITLLTSKIPLYDLKGNISGILGTYMDISERKQAEAVVQREQILSKTIIDSIPGTFYLLDENGRYTRWNAYQRDEIVGKPEDQMASASALDTIHPDDRALVQSKIANVLQNGKEESVEGRVLLRGGPAFRWLLMTGRGMMIEGRPFLVGIGIDITARKQAEAERAALEDQLRQQQRLETVGQLAAGVAHDFNNLLSGISGFTQFAHDDAPKGSALREELAEVLTLAKRAADLTHQLLAFSRRQPLQPVVLNVNDVVRESMKMLQRLLGEHLLLEVNLAAELDMVKVDPGQFEQVLVNLAVNARDAMQAGGQLTIETANVVLDEVYAASHLGTQPGAYVMLAVSDSGTGIDAAVIERIFEPFFSTKGVGKGTGLGLSTVYGIVKQHGGNIWVYSEPGLGTTFKVFLPRVLEDVTRDVAFVPTPSSGTETILLVEDSDAVLKVTLRNLESLGYTVFTATRPSEADAVLQAHGDAIDLLLTDVVMPEQNGRQLYEAAHARFPRLRVLYMSGYTSDAIVHDGVLDPDTPFMEKPFTIDTLARKVREALMGGSDVC